MAKPVIQSCTEYGSIPKLGGFEFNTAYANCAAKAVLATALSEIANRAERPRSTRRGNAVRLR
jgi:hypothetical protein